MPPAQTPMYHCYYIFMLDDFLCILSVDLPGFSKRLMALCETRWVERHEAILTFKVAFPNIILCLEEISDWADNNTASTAAGLLIKLQNSEFIAALCVLNEILSLTVSLSRNLQNPAIDLINALKIIMDVSSILADWRNSDACFNSIFENIQSKLTHSIFVQYSVLAALGGFG